MAERLLTAPRSRVPHHGPVSPECPVECLLTVLSLTSFRQHRPGNLGRPAVTYREPAAPVTRAPDDQQAAAAFVVRTRVRSHGNAGVIVTDEDGQLTLVKGEGQPDEGPVHAGTGVNRIGHQLAGD